MFAPGLFLGERVVVGLWGQFLWFGGLGLLAKGRVVDVFSPRVELYCCVLDYHGFKLKATSILHLPRTPSERYQARRGTEGRKEYG